VKSVLFICLPDELTLWCEIFLPDHVEWSELLISPADSCVTLQLQLFGQLLSQWSGAVLLWMLPSGSDQLCNPLTALFWRWLFVVFVYWDFCAAGIFVCHTPFLLGRFSVPSAPSAVPVLWRFAVCFSVLWDSSVLCAAL
jgi:hypothetical protein